MRTMSDTSPEFARIPSWPRTLVRVLLICGGSVAILLPAWLPNQPLAPVKHGTIVLFQALLLAVAAAVMLGASPHAGAYRPVCRILAMGLIAAVVGEIGDFLSGILGWKFPAAWVVVVILLIALMMTLRHRRVMLHFIAHLGSHAGSGLIMAALLILYVFNRVIGSASFWKASLGAAFSPNIPRICKSYLELLACYFLLLGALGLSITMARRNDSP